MQSFKSVSIIGHALGNKEGKGIQAVMYPLAGLLCSLLSSLSTLSISPFLFYNKYKGILWAGELFYLLSLQPLLYWLLNAFNFPKSPCSIDIGLLVSHCKGRVIGIISAAPPPYEFGNSIPVVSWFWTTYTVRSYSGWQFSILSPKASSISPLILGIVSAMKGILIWVPHYSNKCYPH